MKTARFGLLAVVLGASTLFGASVSAQERAQEQAKEPAARPETSTRAPAAQAAQTPEEQKARAERAAKERVAPPGRGNPANRDAVIGEMKSAEIRHRERLAMIGRLRELALSKGQVQRLAALDKLQAKEQSQYEKHIERQRDVLGADEHRKIKERLAKGRQQRAEREASRPKDGDKGDRPEQAHKAGRVERGNEKDGAPKAERPDKDKQPKQDRPKQDRAEKDKGADKGGRKKP